MTNLTPHLKKSTSPTHLWALPPILPNHLPTTLTQFISPLGDASPYLWKIQNCQVADKCIDTAFK